ncbi:amidohydrolase family protein [Zavarzinia sp. CC-PAN008]|uniref:amidohydrolase family protein n=1 Tax=Zavarzinia sp. CC-PAN008 TaxID=3243332 RepID=UPI003F747A04
MWLTDRQRRLVAPADETLPRTPIPTRMVSNGEFLPLPQTPEQARVERTLAELADRNGRPLGLDRRRFLASATGLASAFLALNQVFGPVFTVARAETTDPDAAAERATRYRDQAVVDVQLHFIRDDYAWDGILALGTYAARWNPVLEREGISFERFKFDNFLREVYFDSDTRIGLISAAPADHGDNVILNNDGLAEARRLVNQVAGSRRMLAHAVIAPGQPGWLDEIDRAVEVLKPDGWKGYTLGDPFEDSRWPWRLDDAALMYPAYERMVKAGVRNVCIHKGLLPEDYPNVFKHWRHAMVDDVGQAARDWPQLNFIIYHSGFRPLLTSPQPLLDAFEAQGQIDWVTDLAAVPARFGVSNVYAELGTTFGSCAITHPRLAAAVLGQLVKGMGADHVVWGTDSVWYGSPQWQIEAFRRIEIPEDMQAAHGFAPLGPPDGPVRNAILAGNAARLFGLERDIAPDGAWRDDLLSRTKADYLAAGGQPSNTFYGFVARAGGRS